MTATVTALPVAHAAEYQHGMYLGSLAASSTHPVIRGLIAEARRVPFAYPVPYGQVRQILGMLPADDTDVERFRASGVLHGYLLATEDEEDAAECSFCGNRVLTGRDRHAEECRDHGWFCDDECRRNICPPNGLGRGNCWED